ncbi:tRNA (adenosine(37)-N6)-threonylcarbamoyltransferase complex dimerization subunit type 1 TsaB [Acetobacter orleanensis]|uniref:tRNA (Adenosine(37)-N6)-threonylcarbamoyltransferase complex dimerization subunit type 1 TsaB n=1 Tax=Acetobacter orleanensis TaxID=104099 RepID=A0A4Y3TN97_9PROT|nr:peptidase [Acetobacter orleanensis JCM 7639]GEB82507.1 tRNA (adenosine(37)-N6)-threonylcarbamoyltransferase complex dimerization subunit type 1 TsaB [Acetobacter orleanensis]
MLDGSPAGDAACGLAACLTPASDGGLTLLAHASAAGKQAAENISLLAAEALQQAGWGAGYSVQPDLVAVVTGPGSFTGLRASCAMAAGYAIGAGCPLVGVTRGEALRSDLEAECARHGELAGWLLVTAARRGRVFVERADGVQAVALADWSPLPGRWLVAGDAAATLPVEGAVISGLTQPTAIQIAAAAVARLTGKLAPRDALPLYVDPPEAKLPAAGLRSAPV